MTTTEADTVCRIMLEADGGCQDCSLWLLLDFAGKFPEHASIAVATMFAAHGKRAAEQLDGLIEKRLMERIDKGLSLLDKRS
jgi:hypothetical protein